MRNGAAIRPEHLPLTAKLGELVQLPTVHHRRKRSRRAHPGVITTLAAIFRDALTAVGEIRGLRLEPVPSGSVEDGTTLILMADDRIVITVVVPTAVVRSRRLRGDQVPRSREAEQVFERVRAEEHLSATSEGDEADDA